jgi:prolyl-tRNA editing enzyme YbaK/EbsC (Cys-tRNA(Pro) deacylase)
MIDRAVRYLCDAGVPFRLAVYPMPEPAPAVAHSLRPGTLLVDTQVVLVDGSPAVACVPYGIPVSVVALSRALDAVVLEASPDELRDEFRGAPEPLPPLGGLFGTPLLLDDEIPAAPRIAFRAFSPGAFVEMTYDDFALVERPRVAAFAQGGELPGAERSSAAHP